MPMSSNDISKVTNGRASVMPVSISNKTDAKRSLTKPQLPEKPKLSAIKKTGIGCSKPGVTTLENCNVSGPQDLLPTKPPQKYLYIKPQTQLNATHKHGAGNAELSNSNAQQDDDQYLVFHEGSLISATLESLIKHMIPTCDYYPERKFIFSFLLGGRLFIRPHELLEKISQAWEQQQHNSVDIVDDANFKHAGFEASASPLLPRKVSASEGEPILSNTDAQKIPRSSTQKSAHNCIRLLSEWIETFPYDFRDERLMQQVRILARKCVYIDNALGKQVSRMLQLLVQRLTALEKYEEFLQSIMVANMSPYQHFNTSTTSFHASSSNTHNTLGKAVALTYNSEALKSVQLRPSPALIINSTSHSESNSHDIFGIMDMCPSCAHLAHQLTAIELERLSHIGPEEFVQAFAKEYQHSIKNNLTDSNAINAALNDMKKTRNLESYVEWFNRLSYLVATEIVKYPKKKQRVRIIEYWIETARECFNIGNFNSLMAIIAGLNLAPISRLKKTWSKVQLAKFSVLEHQMDPTSNFNSYRSTLKAAMWRSEGATEERERIIIPFFSLFVKDLYFLNEGCSNRLPNNHINFEKCSQLAKQVMEFNEWKKVTCPFEKLENVISFLQNSAILNENSLSIASFTCEPPENTEEKERYKTVKAETKQQLLQQLHEQNQQ